MIQACLVILIVSAIFLWLTHKPLNFSKEAIDVFNSNLPTIKIQDEGSDVDHEELEILKAEMGDRLKQRWPEVTFNGLSNNQTRMQSTINQMYNGLKDFAYHSKPSETKYINLHVNKEIYDEVRRQINVDRIGGLPLNIIPDYDCCNIFEYQITNFQ